MVAILAERESITEMRRKAFAQWLIRKRGKMSRAELASRSGISEMQIWRIEKAETGTKEATIEALCMALGIPKNHGLKAAGIIIEEAAKPADEPIDEEFQEIVESYYNQPPKVQSTAKRILRELFREDEDNDPSFSGIRGKKVE